MYKWIKINSGRFIPLQLDLFDLLNDLSDMKVIDDSIYDEIHNVLYQRRVNLASEYCITSKLDFWMRNILFNTNVNTNIATIGFTTTNHYYDEYNNNNYNNNKNQTAQDSINTVFIDDATQLKQRVPPTSPPNTVYQASVSASYNNNYNYIPATKPKIDYQSPTSSYYHHSTYSSGYSSTRSSESSEERNCCGREFILCLLFALFVVAMTFSYNKHN